MKEVRYFCEECEMYFDSIEELYFDSIEELEEMIIIGGYHNVMCCPNCHGSVEIVVVNK